MYNKKSVKEIELKNKRIFLRVDFNVPMENKTVLCDHKIRATIPTIDYILENRPEKLIIGTHLGRPKGRDEKYSVKPIVELFNQMIGVNFSIKELHSEMNGKFIFLENLRFYKEEKEGYNDFFKNNCDFTVIDSFGCVHRNDKSLTGTGLPTVMGLLLEKELNLVKSIFQGVDLTIFGGAKISDKLSLISGIKSKKVWLVGALATTILKSKGKEVGRSKFEENLDLSSLSKVNLKLPSDFTVKNEEKVRNTFNISKEESIVDIGRNSCEEISKDIKVSKVIFWNGPAGIFEKEETEMGTKAIACALAEHTKSGGKVYVGGGETAMAALKYAGLNDFTHISTGGGALMTLLSGADMPGIDAIEDK